MRTSALSFAIGLAMTTVFATGNSAWAQSTTPVDGGTAIVAIGDEPTGLSPGVTTNSTDMMVGCLVYEGLVQISDKGVIEPLLAKSWTVSDDGLTYEFDLQENVKWQDGQPFTADDVAFSITEVNAKYAPLFTSHVAKVLDKVEAIDPHKVRISLKTPFGPMLRMLSCANGGAIHPAHVYKGTDPTKNPATTEKSMGTGAFIASEWQRGDYLRFDKNPTYWQPGKPHLDSVIYKIIPDEAARTQALMSGEVDLIGSYFLSVSDIKTLRANPNIRLEVEGGAPNNLLVFSNFKRKPLDDVKVRQALYTAIDRHYIQETAFSGEGMAATQPFAKQIAWLQSDVDFDKMYAFDLQKAAKMLDDAGYPVGADGTRFTLSITYEANVPEREKAAQAMQDWWRQIGVRLELRPMEQAIVLPKVYQEKDFDLFMISYSTYGDPALGIARAYVAATSERNFGNPSGYSRPEVEALFQEGGEVANLEKRTEAYAKAQAILAEDLPAMVLHSNKGWDAVTTKLHGLWGGEDNGRWENAWLEQ